MIDINVVVLGTLWGTRGFLESYWYSSLLLKKIDSFLSILFSFHTRKILARGSSHSENPLNSFNVHGGYDLFDDTAQGSMSQIFELRW